jgi:hypothetical protein
MLQVEHVFIRRLSRRKCKLLLLLLQLLRETTEASSNGKIHESPGNRVMPVFEST